MATIVQNYGPIYGEVVNGTVQGRPNGSIYVPLSNKMMISLVASHRYIKYVSTTTLRVCNSSGTDSYGPANNINLVAESQDLASYVQIQIYSDSACTQLVAYRNMNAAYFNGWTRDITSIIAGESITDGTTYYLRAQLMNNGVPVATSAAVEIVGVVPE